MARLPGGAALTLPGDRVEVGFPRAACHLFDPDGRAVVNGSLL